MLGFKPNQKPRRTPTRPWPCWTAVHVGQRAQTLRQGGARRNKSRCHADLARPIPPRGRRKPPGLSNMADQIGDETTTQKQKAANLTGNPDRLIRWGWGDETCAISPLLSSARICGTHASLLLLLLTPSGPDPIAPPLAAGICLRRGPAPPPPPDRDLALQTRA